MKRVLSSLLLTVFLFVGLTVAPVLWLVLLCSFGVMCGIEFSTLLLKGRIPGLAGISIASGLVFPINAYLRANGYFNFHDAFLITAVFVSAPMIFFVSKSDVKDFIKDVPVIIYGCLWFGFLPSFMVDNLFFRLTINGMNMPYGVQIILLFMYILVCNDVGAYYGGMAFGKHKLSLMYSPKKTWEGLFIGGAFSFAMANLAWFFFLQELPWIHILMLSILLVTVGVFGDLVESAFKRSCQVKDTGAILPGHGGMLDRLDSMILTTPVFYWYIHYVINN